jgi:hypothetical protein
LGRRARLLAEVHKHLADAVVEIAKYASPPYQCRIGDVPGQRDQ